MKDQDFPLLYFSIIPDNGFNISVLEFHGYKTPIGFFTGVKNRHKAFDWRGVYNSSVQSKIFPYIFICLQTSFLEIYSESKLIDSLDDILNSVLTSSCDEERCYSTYGMMNINLLHIIPYYPSVKLTFEFKNLVKGKELNSIGIYIKPNISCKLIIEDKQRFAS